MKSDWNSLRAALETEKWPGLYTFKFIVPIVQVKDVLDVFDGHKFQHKPSSNGNFVSLTLKTTMQSPDQIIAYYQRIAHIPGIISL